MEIKHRTGIIGGFPNPGALLRLAGSVLSEAHDDLEDLVGAAQFPRTWARSFRSSADTSLVTLAGSSRRRRPRRDEECRVQRMPDDRADGQQLVEQITSPAELVHRAGELLDGCRVDVRCLK